MIIADDEERLYQFLTQGIAALSVVGAVYISDALKSMEVREAPKVSVGVSLIKTLAFDIPATPFPEILAIQNHCPPRFSYSVSVAERD